MFHFTFDMELCLEPYDNDGEIVHDSAEKTWKECFVGALKLDKKERVSITEAEKEAKRLLSERTILEGLEVSAKFNVDVMRGMQFPIPSIEYKDKSFMTSVISKTYISGFERPNSELTFLGALKQMQIDVCVDLERTKSVARKLKLDLNSEQTRFDLVENHVSYDETYARWIIAVLYSNLGQKNIPNMICDYNPNDIENSAEYLQFSSIFNALYGYCPRGGQNTIEGFIKNFRPLGFNMKEIIAVTKSTLELCKRVNKVQVWLTDMASGIDIFYENYTDELSYNRDDLVLGDTKVRISKNKCKRETFKELQERLEETEEWRMIDSVENYNFLSRNMGALDQVARDRELAIEAGGEPMVLEDD
jgi:hypothetical protein